MIIEGAFFKLPELLIENPVPSDQYEGTLTSQLAMAVLLELNARSVQQPMHRIQIERPYPTAEGRPPGRADLFVDLAGVLPESHREAYATYGIKERNWLEAKLFARIAARSGTETKTSNAGAIALDLFRLCLFVPEEIWGLRNNSRYFLLVCDMNPAEYIAFGRQAPNPPRREWLDALVSPGRQEFNIALREEPRSFRSVFHSGDDAALQDLAATLRTTSFQFGPLSAASYDSFFGYLLRITGFRVSCHGSVLEFDETADLTWGAEKSAAQVELSAKLRGAA